MWFLVTFFLQLSLECSAEIILIIWFCFGFSVTKLNGQSTINYYFYSCLFSDLAFDSSEALGDFVFDQDLAAFVLLIKLLVRLLVDT